MTQHTIYSPDGSVHHGDLQPEIAEPSLAILKRDLREMRKHRCSMFIRKPYLDLNELEIVPDITGEVKTAVAVLVTRVVAGETNARVFLNQANLDSAIGKSEILNLCDKSKGGGFSAA
jgi:hypothetical protein